jgi:hypothetical protein
MNMGIWVAIIVCAVAISIFVALQRNHTRSVSIGTSPLVDEAVADRPNK